MKVLRKLKLDNFRSHKSFNIDETKRLIIIIGPNASGKTNIIEAVSLLTAIRSFRQPHWSEVVNTEAKTSKIAAEFDQNGRQLDIEMSVEEGKRNYFLNGKKKSTTDVSGLVPGVTFIPDDLYLVKSGAQTRRDLLDDTGQQLSKNYCQLLGDYRRIIRQKNSVLKEKKKGFVSERIINSWDESLAACGSMLFVSRYKIYKKLTAEAAAFYHKITDNERLSSQYIASFNDTEKHYSDDDLEKMDKTDVAELLKKAIMNNKNEEEARGLSLVGPHKDEIIFLLDGQDARKFASQGQQRSIALALKMAQLAIIRQACGNQPILLLDDVMSELDESRRSELIKIINSEIQTIITATDLKCFNEELLSEAQIIRLI